MVMYYKLTGASLSHSRCPPDVLVFDTLISGQECDANVKSTYCFNLSIQLNISSSSGDVGGNY
jgi:hypothetical protein